MLVSNVIVNGLVCDCGVYMVLVMTYPAPFCKTFMPLKLGCYTSIYTCSVLYLIHNIFFNSYYFLCFMKTIEQLNQRMCLLICKLLVITYLRIKNII